MKTFAAPRLPIRGASGGVALLLGCALAGLGCTKDRAVDATPPTYRDDVAPIALRACVPCHAGDAPAAGWKASDYVAAISCVAPSGEAAVLPADARAPIVRALADMTHRGIVTDAERDTFTRWVASGASDVRDGVHPRGVANPRSPDFHGAGLRAKRYAPMLDASDDQACGRCHDGTLSRPAQVTFAAPGATPCTTCHTESQGVLSCTTCHGDGDEKRNYPPRDPCFFPGDRVAHRAHVTPTDTHVTGLACTTCHPTPDAGTTGAGILGGLHANGTVDVVFDPARVAAGATYDASTSTCAVSCHDRGGARPRPAWSDLGPLGCNDCHASPPESHFPGACSTCHFEADGKGTALAQGPLHMNGKVDLGDGSGACGACHGKGADPWPKTNAHGTHRAPTLASPFTCTSCHPARPDIATTGHLDGTVQIVFGDHAIDRGATPTWDGATCAGVACHGALLPDPPLLPAWTDTSGGVKACTACHGAPPTQHTPSSECSRSDCHGDEVDIGSGGVTPKITALGRSLHVNGLIDVDR